MTGTIAAVREKLAEAHKAAQEQYHEEQHCKAEVKEMAQEVRRQIELRENCERVCLQQQRETEMLRQKLEEELKEANVLNAKLKAELEETNVLKEELKEANVLNAKLKAELEEAQEHARACEHSEMQLRINYGFTKQFSEIAPEWGMLQG